MHEGMLNEELRAFQSAVRKWVAHEVTPHHGAWIEAGLVPRSLWEKAGAQGFLCIGQAERYGGLGLDFRYSVIVGEELARAFASGVAFSLHSDIVAPYVEHYGNESTKARLLPKMAAGTCIGAIAMSEPGTGSDLQAVKTKAVLEDGHWVINGAKTFISNGQNCDMVIVVCRTEDEESGAQSQSLIVVDTDAPGFVRGRHLDKMGMRAQDTTELTFEDCRVPEENLLGERGQGFVCLMNELARERLVIASGCVASAKACLAHTIAYAKERTAFGRPVAAFQNSRHRLAEMATEVEIGEAFVDRCITQLVAGESLTVEASMAKYWTSEMLGRVADFGVQLHGGYGYMMEYPIAQAYVDARVQRIYGGTTEIMKEIISRSIL